MSHFSLRADLGAQRLTRSYAAQFEVREVGEGGNLVELTGYASVVELPYEMQDLLGSYTEVVRAGAFGQTLAARPDVALLANHAGLTMARTASGTLTLSEDSRGLLTVARVNTERSDVRDAIIAVRDGAVDQMSFAFRVDEQAWSPNFDQREIQRVNLDRGDVSIVNFGANPSTSISARGRAQPDHARTLQMRLALR